MEIKPEGEILTPASEVLKKIPGPKEPDLLLDPEAPDPELHEWLNLFEGVEQLDNSELANEDRQKELMEIGRKNETIEMAFEQAYMRALIQLQERIQIDGWNAVYQKAVTIARPNVLPLVKQLYPDLPTENIEGIIAQMGLRSMMKVASDLLTEELEQMKQADADLTAKIQKTKTLFQSREKPTLELHSPVRIETAASSTTSFKDIEQQEAPQVGDAPPMFSLQQLQQMEELRNNPPSLADIAGKRRPQNNPPVPAAPRYPTPPSMRKKLEQQDEN